MAVHSAHSAAGYIKRNDICRLELTIFDFIFSSFVYFFFRLPLQTQKNSKKIALCMRFDLVPLCDPKDRVHESFAVRVCVCVYPSAALCDHALMLPGRLALCWTFFSLCGSSHWQNLRPNFRMALFSNFPVFSSLKRSFLFSDCFCFGGRFAGRACEPKPFG